MFDFNLRGRPANAPSECRSFHSSPPSRFFRQRAREEKINWPIEGNWKQKRGGGQHTQHEQEAQRKASQAKSPYRFSGHRRNRGRGRGSMGAHEFVRALGFINGQQLPSMVMW